MSTSFWLATATFCFAALALDVAERIIEKDRKSPPPEDPYRLERWKSGEPLDPDKEP